MPACPFHQIKSPVWREDHCLPKQCLSCFSAAHMGFQGAVVDVHAHVAYGTVAETCGGGTKFPPRHSFAETQLAHFRKTPHAKGQSHSEYCLTQLGRAIIPIYFSKGFDGCGGAKWLSKASAAIASTGVVRIRCCHWISVCDSILNRRRVAQRD